MAARSIGPLKQDVPEGASFGARAIRGAHPHYEHFVEYGDAEGYHRDLPRLWHGLAPPHRMR